ncbi:hypothetical protein [Virgisporangium ochraceum]|uniref:Uncharacterized protein n=1 Tax=Virgisporangium ochraceum TaxID=65505 RepID=A0A8J4A387_9ACTN|nr:hypothetical protein [Virgisporangium ochraceum]GIJ75032.1 hypothetical protein Voc01_099490 [Virgisporangium ochraceum]
MDPVPGNGRGAVAIVGALPNRVFATGADAERAEGGRSRVLAVVVGRAATARPFVLAPRPVARVVVEPEGGPLAAAFGVRRFPATGVVDDDGASTWGSGAVPRGSGTPARSAA